MQGGLRIANLFKLSNEGMWKRYNFADLERDAGQAHGASEYPQVWDAAAASIQRERPRGAGGGVAPWNACKFTSRCANTVPASLRPIIWHCRNRRRPGERGREGPWSQRFIIDGR